MNGSDYGNRKFWGVKRICCQATETFEIANSLMSLAALATRSETHGRRQGNILYFVQLVGADGS
jgi:hypothetical protein